MSGLKRLCGSASAPLNCSSSALAIAYICSWNFGAIGKRINFDQYSISPRL
jgi:hypothetical protein